MTMAAAAAGTLASMALNLGNLTLVATLGIIACIIYLSSTRGQNTHERRMALLGLGFLSGISVAPLVEIVASIDPAIPVKAFAGAAAVFGCFHVAALRSNDRSFLFLGGAFDGKRD